MKWPSEEQCVLTAYAKLQSVTSHCVVGSAGCSRSGVLQVQLCVEKLSSFSWLGANGDVDIINGAVTVKPGVQGCRWRSFMGKLERP